MVIEGCQGKSATPKILDKVCPQCGHDIDMFSIDTEAICDYCGYKVYNDTLSCVMWCKYAKECVGEEMYDMMMKVAEKQRSGRKNTESAAKIAYKAPQKAV